MVRTIISSLPVVGPAFTEVFNYFIVPGIEKRREQWLKRIDDDISKLKQKVMEIDLGSEGFVSTYIQAMRYAVLNHEEENLQALRNAVLNCLLPQDPDEISQKIFIEWAGELTAWHIRILKIFKEQSRLIPEFNLSDPDWEINVVVRKLAHLIEENYPDTIGNYHLYMLIIKDLHRRGLITNLFPERDMLARIARQPELSPIARDFLKFITSPLDHN